MIWAVVPAKLGKSAKERLAPVLDPDMRERLAQAMLHDVLAALRGAPAVDRTLVISRDQRALELARSSGAEPFREETRGGLNASVEAGLRHCAQQGATGVLIAMGDLPLLAPEDASETVTRLPDRGTVLVPSADGTGTNLVAARPADLFRPQFGPGSLALHLEQMKSGGIDHLVCERAGAALDIDTPADLEALRTSAPAGTASAALLLERTAARLTTAGA